MPKQNERRLSKDEFFAKYKDPRWQKRRLEVMEAAKFTCEECGSKDKELQVHHCLYVDGRNPWDYNRNTLMCVCEECHQWRQAVELGCRQSFSAFIRFRKLEEITALSELLLGIVRNESRYDASPSILIEE